VHGVALGRRFLAARSAEELATGALKGVVDAPWANPERVRDVAMTAVVGREGERAALERRERRSAVEDALQLLAGDCLGERVLVGPARGLDSLLERVALDGVEVSGSSSVDQAPITGESVPVDKHPGDDVFAGTLNTTGSVVVRASRPAADSTLSRVAALVQEAQGSRAPAERLIDRFARVYTPLVFAVQYVHDLVHDLMTAP
jgi:cation transport ATPase